MGISVNAKLFYGYALGDEVEAPDIEKLVDAWLVRRGISSPFDLPDYPQRHSGHYDYSAAKAWREKHQEEIDAWFAAKEGARREIGVDWGWYGSMSYSQSYVYVYGTEFNADWGEVVDIDQLPDVTQEQIDILHAHLAQFGIEPEGKLGWHLVSSSDCA